ncbi:MAG: MFS transporter [Cytophagaceae bacterium]|nr:MFS transporter [Cytophagaceae bacterium]
MLWGGRDVGRFRGGRLTDRWGHYPVQVWSLVLGGLMLLVLGQMRTLPLLCITTFLLSVVGEAFRPANSASVAFYSTPETRTRSYSLNRLAINLGWSIGPAVGGLLAGIGYQYLFWADGVTCLLAAVWLRLFLKNRTDEPTPTSSNPVVPDLHSTPYHDRTFLIFIVFTTCWAIAFFQFFSVVPVYYKSYYHLSEPIIGLVLAANGLLIVFVEMLLIYRIEGRRTGLTFIRMGVVLVGLAYVSFNLLDGWVWVVGVATLLITFGEMVAMPFMTTFTAERAGPKNRGQYLALYGLSWSVAQTTAPLIGTQVAQRIGFTTLWWVMAGFCVLAWLGFWGLEARQTRTPPEPADA